MLNHFSINLKKNKMKLTKGMILVILFGAISLIGLGAKNQENK